MYESLSRRDYNIFWGGCCDIAKSSPFECFLYYKRIPSAILRHKYETLSIVCIECGSKRITKKFNVMVERDAK
jgi:DNA-directed RNA polymerase subunit RPC12/RpoP